MFDPSIITAASPLSARVSIRLLSLSFFFSEERARCCVKGERGGKLPTKSQRRRILLNVGAYYQLMTLMKAKLPLC